MSSIEVTAVTIPELLKRLRSGEWVAPSFQRDFVWTSSQVLALINSVLDAKPIGMATLWEQEDESDLPLESISVNDYISEKAETGARYFCEQDKKPGRYYAILDGKQRSTALAIAFGGLCAWNGAYKFSGKYFLNVCAVESQERIVFKKHVEITKNNLNTKAAYVESGLFPLAMDDTDKMINHWMEFINAIDAKDLYPEQSFPEEAERVRRKEIIQQAFRGLNDTRLAIYIVPKEETLGEICDIFETLNTTGTKVSTVDLIHSWVYSETIKDKSPIELRSEIDRLGELPGADGWASSEKRPEIIAQVLASIQIVLDSKHEPRPVSGRKVTKITSIKSSDLLAISSKSWREFFDQREFVAQCFKDFQDIVAAGRFSLLQCPYPGVVSVYLAMRWYLEFDNNTDREWGLEHLNRLYRAFFWKNAFSKRYDQGFLTRVGADVSEFKAFLNQTPKDIPLTDWAVQADEWLNTRGQMQSAEIIAQEVDNALSDGNTKGALRSASLLLLYTRSREDILDVQEDISNLIGPLELHHIYPKSWCRNNKTKENENYVNTHGEKNWVDSPANLMPLSKKSNIQWEAKEPSMALSELGIDSQKQHNLLLQYFIDPQAQTLLKDGPENIGKFLERRKNLIRDEIIKLMRV